MSLFCSRFRGTSFPERDLVENMGSIGSKVRYQKGIWSAVRATHLPSTMQGAETLTRLYGVRARLAVPYRAKQSVRTTIRVMTT